MADSFRDMRGVLECVIESGLGCLTPQRYGERFDKSKFIFSSEAWGELSLPHKPACMSAYIRMT